MNEQLTTTDDIVYVGAYADDDAPGGIYVLHARGAGKHLSLEQHLADPQQAGYIAIHHDAQTLYAVDERKTDGRGPVDPAAAVHTFTIDSDGRLAPHGTAPALGAFPTYLSVAPEHGLLFSVSHGSFDHVERVVRDAEGGWRTEFVYDDSTVVSYDLALTGRIERVADVRILDGHGTDPNRSPQAGGHGQASAHAHCGVIDPSGRFLLVADKATDRIYTFEIDRPLRLASTFQAAAETGPRHLVFDTVAARVLVTYEFSSEVASLEFDPATGVLSVSSVVSTLGSDPGRVNEPADVQIHPGGHTVYVNNRGEDAIAWFSIAPDGALHREGHVSLSASVHPGLAARSLAVSPRGDYLLVSDRPAGLVRSYGIVADGSLTPRGEFPVPGAAFVCIVPAATGTGEGAAV